MGETFYADGVNVPSQGWVLFGGDGAKLRTGQQLRSVDSEWEEGPTLYENSTDSTYCLTQVQYLPNPYIFLVSANNFRIKISELTGNTSDYEQRL